MPLPRRRIVQRPKQVKAGKSRHSSAAVFGFLKRLRIGAQALGTRAEFEEVTNAVRAVLQRGRFTAKEKEVANLRLDGWARPDIERELTLKPGEARLIEAAAIKKILIQTGVH